LAVKLRRRHEEDTNLSFLDVIACGFGAIILLLMITKVAEPVLLEQASRNLDGLVADLQRQLFAIRGETTIFNRELTVKNEQLSENREKIARLLGDLNAVKGEFAATKSQSVTSIVTQGELELARQKLTEEMQSLLGRDYKRSDSMIGGIPVDSEYLIFIIDTSGSMFSYAWLRMQRELIATLNIYPQVKGIQIMNDMGKYMFTQYRGKWIPDTPGRRQAIIKRIRTWNPYSNSSPVEGITNAIRTFYSSDKKISLYVFGDDFRGNSIRTVLNEVDRINAEDEHGQRRVRIHAVGFPVIFSAPSHLQSTAIRFAALLRELCYDNGGTFVGLNDFK
jgi:hypothetical protein